MPRYQYREIEPTREAKEVFNRWIDSMAVSYTHLDVYKRQAEGLSIDPDFALAELAGVEKRVRGMVDVEGGLVEAGAGAGLGLSLIHI